MSDTADDFKRKSGLRLRALRHDKGFSQQKVALILDISRSAISEYELGKNNMTLYLASRFMTLYDAPLDYLSEGKNLNRVLLDPVQRLVRGQTRSE